MIDPDFLKYFYSKDNVFIEDVMIFTETKVLCNFLESNLASCESNFALSVFIRYFNRNFLNTILLKGKGYKYIALLKSRPKYPVFINKINFTTEEVEKTYFS